MALSELKISKAKPKDKPYKLADGGGLFLLINRSGRNIDTWGMDLSRFSSAPSSHLSGNSFESQGAFQPNGACLRRGL